MRALPAGRQRRQAMALLAGLSSGAETEPGIVPAVQIEKANGNSCHPFQRYRVFSPHLLYTETFRCRRGSAAGPAGWSAAPTGNGAFSWSTIEGLKQNPVTILRSRSTERMGTPVRTPALSCVFSAFAVHRNLPLQAGIGCRPCRLQAGTKHGLCPRFILYFPQCCDKLRVYFYACFSAQKQCTESCMKGAMPCIRPPMSGPKS